MLFSGNWHNLILLAHPPTHFLSLTPPPQVSVEQESQACDEHHSRSSFFDPLLQLPVQSLELSSPNYLQVDVRHTQEVLRSHWTTD